MKCCANWHLVDNCQIGIKMDMMDFDMNNVGAMNNNNTSQVESHHQEQQGNGDPGQVASAGASNVDTNTLAAVLQFLQKHNLKVTGFICTNLND